MRQHESEGGGERDNARRRGVGGGRQREREECWRVGDLVRGGGRCKASLFVCERREEGEGVRGKGWWVFAFLIKTWGPPYRLLISTT